MRVVLDGTDTTDRHYESMQRSFENLQKYSIGKFTLFNGNHRVEEKTVAENTVTEEPRVTEEKEDVENSILEPDTGEIISESVEKETFIDEVQATEQTVEKRNYHITDTELGTGTRQKSIKTILLPFAF